MSSSHGHQIACSKLGRKLYKLSTRFAFEVPITALARFGLGCVLKMSFNSGSLVHHQNHSAIKRKNWFNTLVRAIQENGF